MSKPSPRLIQGLLRLRFNRDCLSTMSKPSSDAMSTFRDIVRFSSSSLSPSSGSSMFPSKLHFNPLSSNPTFSKVGISQVFYCPRHNPRQCFNPLIRGLALAKPQSNFSSGIRFFSFKSSGLGRKVDGNFAKSVLDKPVAAISSAFSRYREAIGLQIDAFCKNNYLVLLGGGAVLVCALLWRAMFGIANAFVGISEGLAKYGFLALSTAIVAFFGLYLRSRFTINPDKVYRMAMRRLNTSAGVLEVMGAPLTGTDLRAYVMSGGGITLKTFKPSFRSKRCFLIFPIRGSERKGLVSVGVKNKKGQYDIKLLAVDIPMASGPDQRLFLVGDEEDYNVGGGLISQLRDPVVKAMAASKEFDDLDRIEEEEDAERELQEAERKHQEEIDKLEKDSMR